MKFTCRHGWPLRPVQTVLICDCDLFLLVMGCTGADEIVTITQYEHFHWILFNPFVVISGIAVAIVQCKWVFTLKNLIKLESWQFSDTDQLDQLSDKVYDSNQPLADLVNRVWTPENTGWSQFPTCLPMLYFCLVLVSNRLIIWLMERISLSVEKKKYCHRYCFESLNFTRKVVFRFHDGSGPEVLCWLEMTGL